MEYKDYKKIKEVIVMKWDTKKVVLYLLATVFITYGIGSAILFSNPKKILSFNGSVIEKSNYDINEEKTSSLNGINSISINTSSTGINIIPSNETGLKAQLKGNVVSSSPYSNPELECYASGSTVYVNVKNKTTVTFGFFSSTLKLDVYIPSNYAENLKVNSSSGSINIKGMKLSRLECNSSSGSISINDIAADEFICNSSSGSLRGDGLTTKSSRITSSSGSKRITRFVGDLKATSSSGSTRIEYVSFENNLDIDSSSGSVEIKLPENSQFYLDATSSSGRISTRFPVTVIGSNDKHQLKGTVGSDKNKVKIHTSSGSINIDK